MSYIGTKDVSAINGFYAHYYGHIEKKIVTTFYQTLMNFCIGLKVHMVYYCITYYPCVTSYAKVA